MQAIPVVNVNRLRIFEKEVFWSYGVFTRRWTNALPSGP